jgi:thiamine biosynthesis lipoprotein
MERAGAVEKEFKALGTDIYFQIVCDENLKREAEGKAEELQNFYFSSEKIFSRFLDDSELNKFNSGLGKFSKASPHFLELAKKILDYYELSEGIFDPRIIKVLEWTGYREDFRQNRLLADAEKSFPEIDFRDLKKDLIIQGEAIMFNCKMDFSGIAKGYITDIAGEMLRKSGFQNFLIDSGGDMCASGVDQRGENWKIDIEGIAQERIMLILKNEAIATSGIGKRKWERDGKRFHHIINPKSPEKFSFDLQSVTVVAKTVTEADFWAKVLFLKGQEAGRIFSLEKKIKSIFLDYRGNVWVSREMKKNI